MKNQLTCINMKGTTFLVLVIFLLSSCRNSDPGPDGTTVTGLLTDQNITVSNVDRDFHLFIPDQASDAPVVILFHGHAGDNDELLGLGGESAPYKVWIDIAEEENIILAIPNGLRTSSNEKGWNDCRADASTNSTADDVAFTSSLIDLIVENYDADAKRIYVMGTSNGGHFCIRLANELAEKITAFASIISSSAVNSECSESSIPISALFMNGTADPFLPYEGGAMASNRGEVFATEFAINYWINRNGTDSEPEFTGLADGDSSDDSSVDQFYYKNGTNNTEVVLYEITNGGHTEPSKAERYSAVVTFLLGNQNGDIEMAEEVWSFFKDKVK